MYRNLTSENKKYGMLTALVILLFSFVFAIIINNFVPAAAITSTKGSGLFGGTNVDVTVSGLGTEVSNRKNKEIASDFEYGAVLPFIYTRKVTAGVDTEENILTTQGPSGKFSLEFYVYRLGCDTTAIEFTDYQDDKKSVRIEFDFSGFHPADEDEGTPAGFIIDAYLGVTDNNWKTEFVRNDNNKTSIDLSGFFTQGYPENGQEEDILQNIRFTLGYDTPDNANGFSLYYDERDTSGDTEVFNPISHKNLSWTTVNPLFTQNTAKMSVEYKGNRSREVTDIYGPTTEYIEHAVTFARVNGQSLAADVDGIEPESRQLPVINRDKKVTKDFAVTPTENTANYTGLKASRKTTVTLPVLITDAANFSIYCYIEIWKVTFESGVLVKEKVDTKTLVLGSSGVSYYFEDEGYYEVRVYAGNLNSLSEVEEAAKLEGQEYDDEQNPEGNFGRIVTETFTYYIESSSAAPRLKTLAEDGVDGAAELTALINQTFTSVWQNLPEYQENFTFPRPDGLFTNGVDEDYTLSFLIYYKHESDATFVASSSLSFNISKTGLFVFRYVVKSPTQRTNLETGADFYDEDYPEFKLRFSDISAPNVDLSLHQMKQTLTEGDSFTIPTPSTLTDNSGTATLISDETRLFYGYARWTADKGLKDEDGNDLSEVELNDDGAYVFDTAGTYYFIVFYQAEDAHNNKTADFPSDTSNILDAEKSFYLITITVEEPETDANNTLLIILIILGGLSFVGIVALLFIKPIDESTKKSRRKA